MLREGTSVIRGTISASSGANQLPPTPKAASQKVVRRTAGARSMINQLQTPPTTAPQPSSSAPIPTPIPPAYYQPRTRQPLASLAVNIISSSQSEGTQDYQLSSSMPARPTFIEASFKSAITMASQIKTSSQPRTTPPARDSSLQNSQSASPNSSLPMVISGSGVCRLTRDRCPLMNYLFLLSPCISTSPYILENLLPWHGSRVVTSLRAFSNPSLPRHCTQTGRTYRKVALVEPNRTEQTVEFLQRIQGLNLRRGTRKRKGKGKGRERETQKQWVEVYDWRLLECVAKQDRGRELGYNPWRRCWMGAV